MWLLLTNSNIFCVWNGSHPLQHQNFKGVETAFFHNWLRSKSIFFFKFQNLLVSNYQMHLSQITKEIYIKFQNIFVAKMEKICQNVNF